MDFDLDRLLNAALYLPLVLVMGLETLAPRRTPIRATGRRWFHVACLWSLDTWLARGAVLTAALYAAAEAGRNEWGLLRLLPLSGAAAFVAGFLLIDLAAYWKHRAFHVFPVLWQLHVVHHSDVDMDVATGLRHHPADYLLDGFVTAVLVFALGIPPAVVLAYQVISLVHNAWRHGNIAVPVRIEAVLRKGLVTPDVHRIHHSAAEAETNSNYGVIFPWWDMLFGTWNGQPARGHADMTLGLEYFREASEDGLVALLLQPVRQPRARARALAGERGSEASAG